jgi:hypothetical protein
MRTGRRGQCRTSEAFGPRPDEKCDKQEQIGQPTRWAHTKETDGLYGSPSGNEPVQRASPRRDQPRECLRQPRANCGQALSEGTGIGTGTDTVGDVQADWGS